MGANDNYIQKLAVVIKKWPDYARSTAGTMMSAQFMFLMN